jgi:acyl-coenzyme A thioesterase PaaI-like protein
MSKSRVVSAEILEQHAQRWNAHPSLGSFGVTLSFPDAALVRIVVDSVPLSMRGGLGDDAVVNGGVLSALCDLLIGSTCALVDPESRSATVQLSIRFERPLRGVRIVGEARVDRATGRLVFASAEIGDGSGPACVRCQGIATLLGSRPGE